jgi:hypothetical protein
MRPKPEIVDLRFDLYGLKPQYIAVGDQQSLWVTCAATTEVVGLMRDCSIFIGGRSARHPDHEDRVELDDGPSSERVVVRFL